MMQAQYFAGMFVRINESGGRRYLQVVESYRNEAGKPRHRVVANLGRLDDKDGSQLDAHRGLCRAAGREEPARVEITHEPARAFGDVFVLHELWNELGFDRALGRALRSGKRKLDVEAVAIVTRTNGVPMATACHGVQPPLRAGLEARLPALS